MIVDRVGVSIGPDARPVAETPPDDADPADVARALCADLGPLLGTNVGLRALSMRREGAVTVAEVNVGETGPAGEWTVDAAAAEVSPPIAAQRAVIAALLGDTDVLTGAMQRFVRSGLLAGGILAVGDGQPVQVGDLENPPRLVELIDLVPTATMVGVRTGRGDYGAIRTHRHACVWLWREERGELLRSWFRALVAADSLGTVVAR